MGVVFKATQTALDRTVALKAIAPQLAEESSFRERFQRESHLAASIEHPNVIPVYEAGERDGTLYLIMRWVDGTDLRALLTSEGHLAPERAVRLLLPVASALAAAHRRGLVHRDIKPANVLIARGDGGQDEHVYLTDFGIARRGKGDSMTRTGVLVGTIDYLAPERIEGGRGDASSDIYAFGCMLYETLTGHVPFDRPTDLTKMYAHMNDPVPRAADEVPGISEHLDAVIAKAMAKDPADRFASASELAAALSAVDTAESESGEQPSRSEQPTEPVERTAAETELATATIVEASATKLREDRTAPTTAPARQRRSGLLVAAVIAGIAAVIAVVIVVSSGGGSGHKTSSTPAASTHSLAPPKGSGDPSVQAGAPVQLTFTPTALTTQGGAAWVAGPGVVAQVESGHVQPTSVEGTPNALALDSRGRVWFTNPDAGTASFLGSQKPVSVGAGPVGIAMTAHAAWVASSGAKRVTRIDLETLASTAIPLPSPPVVIGQAYGRIWVALQDGSVKILQGNGQPDPIAAPSIPGVVGLTPAFGVWFLSSDGTLNRVDPRSSVAVTTPSGQSQYREYRNQGSAGSSAVGPDSFNGSSTSLWALSRTSKTLSEIASNGSQITHVIAAVRFGASPEQLAVGDGIVWVSVPSAKLLYPVSTG